MSKHKNPEFIALAKELFFISPHLISGCGDAYLGNDLWFGAKDNQLVKIHQNYHGKRLLTVNVIDDNYVSYDEIDESIIKKGMKTILKNLELIKKNNAATLEENRKPVTGIASPYFNSKKSCTIS